MEKVFLVIARKGKSVGNVKVYKNKKDAEEFAEIVNNLSIGFIYSVEEHNIL